MDRHRMLRPLLPAGALSESCSSDTSSPADNSPSPAAPRSKVACRACQRRKSRCSGLRPACAACQARRTECHYETMTQAETRVQALKRNISRLDRENSAFEDIYSLLRTRPEAEASEIVRRIRQGEKPSTILRLVQHGDLLLQVHLTPEMRYRYEFPYLRAMPAALQRADNPYLSSLVYEFAACKPPPPRQHSDDSDDVKPPRDHRDVYLMPYHAAHMVDPLIASVRPSEWTSVNHDDALMRRLLEIYFLNEYQSLTCFQKDHFLRDMRDGRGRFCSPLLVNAVLAAACLCDSSDTSRSEYWNPVLLGYRFFAEAKRLWEVETLTSRLTSVQAAVLLNVVHNTCCQDKVGWIYAQRAVAIAEDLEIFAPSPFLKSRDEADARNFTAWALFSFQSLHAFMLFDPPLMSRPPDVPLPDPALQPAWYSEVWLKYPSGPSLCPSHFGAFFRARAELRVISNDLLEECLGPNAVSKHLSAAQASIYYSRLRQWYDGLPEVLSPRNIVLPSHLLLHINYQNVLLSICEPLIKSHSATGTRDPFNPTAIDLHALIQIRDTAQRHFETALRLYFLRHGFGAGDLVLVQPLTVLAFQVLDRLLPPPGDPKISQATPNNSTEETSESLRSTMTLAFKGLHDQGDSFYVAQVSLALLASRLPPAETAAISLALPQLLSRVLRGGGDGGPPPSVPDDKTTPPAPSAATATSASPESRSSASTAAGDSAVSAGASNVVADKKIDNTDNTTMGMAPPPPSLPPPQQQQQPHRRRRQLLDDVHSRWAPGVRSMTDDATAQSLSELAEQQLRVSGSSPSWPSV